MNKKIGHNNILERKKRNKKFSFIPKQTKQKKILYNLEEFNRFSLCLKKIESLKKDKSKSNEVQQISHHITNLHEDLTSTKNDFEQRDVYEVETILAKRFNRLRKRLEYFIVWKNYKKSEGTWEGLENLDGCLKKVKEFELNSIPGHCINSLINEGENVRPLKRKFGVEKIISSRTNNIRKVNEYLVSFNGFEKFEWINSKNLLNCEYLKKDFENRSYDIFSIRKL